MRIDNKEITGNEFFTVEFMSKNSGKNKEAVKKILKRAEIFAVSKNAIYKKEAWEKVISTPGPGKPKKTATPEKTKAKKAK